MTVTALPLPAPGEPAEIDRDLRWLPTRAGILNVWRYYDEVFEFHQGRLLLRGPNGSGKSKALELLLPFLFDANLRANRLSTFGTGERTMHWNLMGEGASGTTRVGYVWLECQLRDFNRTFVCGARLQASAHTTTVHPDYFTTTLRVGDGLELVNDAGQPLTRAALEERLGDYGTVHANATDYRAEVRATLFPTLTEQRFDALITALLQLRTPKLSQRLDPALLSTLLSKALPPLGRDEIADLAEGFERLDAQRERLTRLDDEVAATATLARRQQTYAQRVLRASAAAVIAAESELKKLAEAARASATEHDTVAAQQRAAEVSVAELETLSLESLARQEGLKGSKAYEQGRELDRLRAQTAEATRRAAHAADTAEQSSERAAADTEASEIASATVLSQTETVRALAETVREAATRAGVTGAYDELAVAPAPTRALVRAAVRSARERISVVEATLDRHERAVEHRGQSERDVEIARTMFADAQDAQHTALARRGKARAAVAAELSAWAATCRELPFDDPDALAEHVDSEPGLLAAVNAVATTVTDDLTRADTTLSARKELRGAEHVELTAEAERLTGEQELPPTAPPTRTTDRATLAGAPLWQLIDFAAKVPADSRADIEAALQASGLLDAWIGPLGQVSGHDVFADPYALTAVPGRSLADILVPERKAPVDQLVVMRLLEAVAFDDQLPESSTAAIGADGGWRMGPLHGSWSKPHTEHIGAGSRQRARERKLAEVRTRITAAAEDLAKLDVELAGVAARRAALTAERATLPSRAPLRAADTVVNRAEAAVAVADAIVRQRLTELTVREREVSASLVGLTAVAAETGLPTERAALARMRDAVASFDEQAQSWIDEHKELSAVRHDAQRQAAVAARSAEQATADARGRAESDDIRRTLAAELTAVESAFGADYRDVLDEIDQLRVSLRALEAQLRDTRAEVTRLARRLGELTGSRAADAAAHDAAADRRDLVSNRFRHLIATTLLTDSQPAAEAASLAPAGTGVRATLDAARAVAAAWPAAPHAPHNVGDALNRLSASVHECRATLSARADLDLETDVDIQIFTAIVDGVRVGAAELLQILREEAALARTDITERERDLFDQTLTGDTRRHLAARIRQANELVDSMNARLERVRTASNVAVRLVWRVAPDLPRATAAARDLLLKDPARLTDTDRESLHRFLRDRVEAARADDTAASWEEQLSQVFDYTNWHRFDVKINRGKPDGEWQLLTKKLHGALSGGEKAIALHLPLFAAVAAHYHSAPEAPRVILLDEVFVGVDTANRGQIFALLAALDLDLVLTSDHEWCTYAELDGIGIHQLITADGDDAVTTAHFTWTGSELLDG